MLYEHLLSEYLSQNVILRPKLSLTLADDSHKKICGIQLFLFKELIPACSHKVLEKKTFKRLRKNLPYEHEGAFAGNNSLDPNFNFTGWKFLQH